MDKLRFIPVAHRILYWLSALGLLEIWAQDFRDLGDGSSFVPIEVAHVNIEISIVEKVVSDCRLGKSHPLSQATIV